jgi:hypothetical protein
MAKLGSFANQSTNQEDTNDIVSDTLYPFVYCSGRMLGIPNSLPDLPNRLKTMIRHNIRPAIQLWQA